MVVLFPHLLGNEWLLEGQPQGGSITDVFGPVCVAAQLPGSTPQGGDPDLGPSLTLSVWVYFCVAAGGACMMKAVAFCQPLNILPARPREAGEELEVVTVAMTHTLL